jgi:hypothetical protein
MLARIQSFVEGYKSYLAAGSAALVFVAGEFGWISDAHVETGLTGLGIVFGAALAAKASRILKALKS